MARPAPGDRDTRKLPIAPLLWAIGYSGLHVTVLLRAVMAYQKPALLGSLSFWVVSMTLVTVCVAFMTAGWGTSTRR